MKKLLLVLLVVTLASFLFVGCIPVTPSEGEGEGEGEGEAEICPTVAVTSQVTVAGKNFIKGGSQTVTITFAVPTEPVSAFTAENLKGNPDGVPDLAEEIVLYTADGGLTYTGTVVFAGDCDEGYIYVLTCETCGPCKYPYTVDSLPPAVPVTIGIKNPDCAGCELLFDSTVTEDDCDPDVDNCKDACSGFASWSLDVYDADPFDECCLVPCETPVASYSGDCPIDVTTAALGAAVNPAYIVLTQVDNVGNLTRWGATLTFNADTCTTIAVETWPDDDCVDTPTFVAGTGVTITGPNN